MAVGWLPAVAVLLVACGPEDEVTSKPSIESVRADLETHLQPDSTPEQVASFVNARHYYSDAPVDPALLSPRIGRPDELELPSIIRNTGRLGPVSYAIAMRFVFDRARKLKAIEVKEVGTGP